MGKGKVRVGPLALMNAKEKEFEDKDASGHITRSRIDRPGEHTLARSYAMPSENRRRAKPRSSDKIWFGQSAQLSSAFVGKLPFFRCILSSSV